MNRPSFERLALVLLLAAFLLLAAGYSVAAPLGEAPDEVGHLAYVESLLKNGRLPEASGAVTGEAKQPPLYYMLGALTSSFVPRSDFWVLANPDFTLSDPQAPNLLLHTRREAFPFQGTPLAWHLVRLLSVALGAVTVWATWRIGMEVLGEPWVALAGAAFVAFLPEFLFVSGAVNNDNLVTALSSLAILQSVRMLKRPLTLFSAIGLGALLGLAAFAKLSGLVVWVFAALPFLSAVRSGSGWRRTLLQAVLCFGTAALILTPWLINNLVAYGDPLAWGLVTAVSDVRQAPMAAGDWLNLGVRLLGSAGGRFGGASHISALPVGYMALALFGVLALSGWMLYALRAKSSDIPLGVHRLLILFGVFWAVLLAAFVRWTLTALGTDQSRLLFPGISLLALFLVAGFARLFEHRQTIALQLLIVVLCLVGAANLIYLGGIYAPPSGASAASAHPAADFEGTIRLLDYRLSTTRAAPGESVVVQFDWQSLKETSESYWLLLQLASPKEAVANKDGVPTAGRVTTDWWKKGQVLSGHHTLTLPPDIEPGTYELRVGLHPFGRWEWLRTGGRDMFVLGRLVVAPKE